MRTANPALNAKAFGRVEGMVDSTVMTVQGAVLKTGFLTILLGGAAVYTWDITYKYAAAGDMAAIQPWLWGGIISGLVLALITIFAPKASPFTSPLYAIAEGLFLGALSALYDKRFPGLPIQAVGLTFCTLFAMLLLYTTGVIRATPAFRRGIMAATFGIMLIYLLTFVNKTVFWCLAIALVKAFVPRFRYDQLMRLGWKIFLPASLVAVVVTAAWRVCAVGA